MRLLHTSDWHLGQKFITLSREPEQQLALDWLLEIIEKERVDALIVAGDIFDVNNPPVSAEEMYYRFLSNLKRTGCRHVVIVGGNHDSPFKLNAPRRLLKTLDVHVVGATTGQPEEELILLERSPGDNDAVMIMAVPFLRERDFRTTVSGETADDRIRSIQEGIVSHYRQLAGLLTGFEGPVLATGHLYARGASTHEEQQNIYLGNLDNIAAEQFPDRIDYIALGHIHRMQKVGKRNHIRYCGSLIPLSFSEIDDKKGVIIVDLEKGKTPVVRELIAPVFRRLLILKGSMAEVEQKLQKAHQASDLLPAWVEIVVTGDPGVVLPDRHLRELAADLHLEILKVKIERNTAALSAYAPGVDLSAMTPDEVFEKRCLSKGLSETEITTVVKTFQELKAWLTENGERVK